MDTVLTTSEQADLDENAAIVVRTSLYFLFIHVFFLFALFSIGLFVLYRIDMTMDLGWYTWLLMAGIGLLEFLGLVYLFLRWYYKYYKITKEHIIYNEGVILIRRRLFSVRNIESVALKQSVWGRMMGYGDLVLQAPTITESITLKEISKPWKYLRIVKPLIPKLSPQIFTAKK